MTSRFLVTLAAVTGACGASLVVAHHLMQRRAMSLLLWLVYLFVGAVLAVAVLCALMIAEVSVTPEQLYLISLTTGAFGSVFLAGLHWGTRIALKYRNIGMTIDFTNNASAPPDNDK